MSSEANAYIALSRARRMLLSGEAARLRRKAKLSQRDVAEACDVTVHTISGWETGRISPGHRAGHRYAELLMTLAAELDGEDRVAADTAAP